MKLIFLKLCLSIWRSYAQRNTILCMHKYIGIPGSSQGRGYLLTGVCVCVTIQNSDEWYSMNKGQLSLNFSKGGSTSYMCWLLLLSLNYCVSLSRWNWNLLFSQCWWADGQYPWNGHGTAENHFLGLIIETNSLINQMQSFLCYHQ